MAKKTILIVEDEKPQSKILKTKLESEGFSVLQAFNGRDGLDVALKEDLDMILLDIVMPEMDGLTFLDKIKEHDTKTPIIVLSNLSDDEALARSMSDGVRDYLVKSDWTLEDVVEKVKEKIG